MKLLVGLGNPGPKYETTRHNVGFLVLDEIAAKFSVSWSGEKFQGIIGKGNVLGVPCVLLKPQTFMNVSGRSLREALNFFKISEEDVVVIFDDIDQESGKVKARKGGGHGGHNGIRSILAEAGIQEFHRVKVGVGRPKTAADGSVSNWVLAPMSDQELVALQNEVLQDVMLRLENIFKQRQKSE